MSGKSHKPEWLSGYYPPTMGDWVSWRDEWSMGPHAEADWVWFDGYYTESEARKRLAAAKDEDRKGS